VDLDLPLPSSSMGDTRREPDSPPAPAPAPEDADVRWMISLCDTALRITGNLTDSVGAGVLDLRCSANSSIQSWRRRGGGMPDIRPAMGSTGGRGTAGCSVAQARVGQEFKAGDTLSQPGLDPTPNRQCAHRALAGATE
jgi:hypothetical protein